MDEYFFSNKYFLTFLLIFIETKDLEYLSSVLLTFISIKQFNDWCDDLKSDVFETANVTS